MTIKTKNLVKPEFNAGQIPIGDDFADLIDSYVDQFVSTSNPTADDDIDNGYVIGSAWINSNTWEVFKCIDNTSGKARWNRVLSNYNDFIDTFTNGLSGVWTSALAGAGSIAQIAPPNGVGGRNGVIGVMRLSVRNSGNYYGSIVLSNLLFFQSGNYYLLMCRVRIDELSTIAQNARFRIGFIDSNTNTEPTDGAYFEYNIAESANWLAKTANNNVRSTTITGTIVNTDWIDLKILIDATTPSAKFFINDILVATILTNIPTTSGRETSIGFVLHKSAGNGATKTVSIEKIAIRNGLS